MSSQYSLDQSSYTIKNAATWGNFTEHCKKASVGKLGDRLVHIIIAALQLLPIIGQIASLMEMLIMKKTSLKPQTLNLAALTTLTQNLKSNLITQIAHQKLSRTYLRETLETLRLQDANHPIPLHSIPHGITHFSKNATYYGYNAEGVRDHGWGCAFRAIQTCLSSYNITVPFKELFHLFGPASNLKQLFKNKYPNENIENEQSFAPYDLVNGWAEPFIGEMVMHFHEISASLECVNSIPACNAPRQVFHNKALSFTDFSTRLERHFKTEKASPVMIDDGLTALNIIGMGRRGTDTILWIADPHIKDGVNNATGNKTPCGLYSITLDGQGKQIDCSLFHEDAHQLPGMYCQQSYTGLHFANKPWMVLFPQDKFS